MTSNTCRDQKGPALVFQVQMVNLHPFVSTMTAILAPIVVPFQHLPSNLVPDRPFPTAWIPEEWIIDARPQLESQMILPLKGYWLALTWFAKCTSLHATPLVHIDTSRIIR